MKSFLNKIIDKVQNAEIAFTKFITPNDTGKTGGHQSGFHIHKCSWRLMFDSPGEKGLNKDRFVKIKWQDQFETDSRFIYYGSRTRNEYRLTRFGRNFPFLTPDNVGDLLIIVKISSDYFEAFILSSDHDIEDFFAAMNITSTDTNNIIPKRIEVDPKQSLYSCFESFILKLNNEFPSTIDLSTTARNCYNLTYRITDNKIRSNPDKELLHWVDAEFQLFKLIENVIYSRIINKPFNSVEQLIKVSNSILNRRKSRAGKSLEHHLSGIFNVFNVCYDSQALIEGNKRPDFIFPSVGDYLDMSYDESSLFFLAAKTTCKDRWRQILNEADRIKIKHLFTLQQGISLNQLNEMYKAGVCLVVPDNYIKSFPREFQNRILSLKRFTDLIKHSQAN